MAGDPNHTDRDRPLRYENEDEDPDFQREWLDARHLSWEQVERAWRHGFDARDRFADRPFDEVRDWLRESWRGLGAPAPWEKVEDIIRSGYDRYKGAGFGPSTDSAAEALEHFKQRTIGGSVLDGGVLGERSQQGDTRGEPESPEPPGS